MVEEKKALLDRPNKNLDELIDIARTVRRKALEISFNSRSGHLGGAFSAADLMTALYFRFLRLDAENPANQERDRFVLSKGHACSSFYVCLQMRGIISAEELSSFGKDGGIFGHHPDLDPVRGIEASTGSLGHGLPIAAGMAFAAKRTGLAWRTVALLSDGELNEGSVWEAIMFAGHHGLDNLLALVDFNKIQALGRVEEIIRAEPLHERWKSFGWSVRRIDGHDMVAIAETLESVPFEKGKPSVIIADTVKGKGVSFMEDRLLWHYRCPDDKEFRACIEELDINA